MDNIENPETAVAMRWVAAASQVKDAAPRLPVKFPPPKSTWAVSVVYQVLTSFDQPQWL